MHPPQTHAREIPPELAADCSHTLAFRTEVGWKHVAGQHGGWADMDGAVRIVEPEPLDRALNETAGCLTTPSVQPDGTVEFIRFILMSPDMYKEVAASIGQPVLSDEECRAMIADITF